MSTFYCIDGYIKKNVKVNLPCIRVDINIVKRHLLLDCTVTFLKVEHSVKRHKKNYIQSPRSWLPFGHDNSHYQPGCIHGYIREFTPKLWLSTANCLKASESPHPSHPTSRFRLFVYTSKWLVLSPSKLHLQILVTITIKQQPSKQYRTWQETAWRITKKLITACLVWS